MKLKLKISTQKQEKEEFSEKLKSKNVKIFVVEEKGNLVGFCVGSIEESQHFKIKKIGYINYCFVDEKFRGKSIGKDLVNELINWFKKKNVKVAELGVLHSNVSVSIWRKLGFSDYYIKMRRDI